MIPIPYDEIIARANARKEALQAFDAALHDFVHHLPELHAAIGAVKTLVCASDALDAEARSLLPSQEVQALRYWCTRVHEMYEERHAKGVFGASANDALQVLAGPDAQL